MKMIKTLLPAGAAIVVLCVPALWPSEPSGTGYRALSGKHFYYGSASDTVADPQALEGALPAVRIDAESIVHVSYDGRQYTFVLASDEGQPLVQLTSIPYLGSQGALEPGLEVAWFQIHAGEGLTAFLLEYSHGFVGRRSVERQKFLGVCVVQHARPSGSCQSLALSETSILGDRQEDPREKWLYLAMDSSEPAYYGDACPFARDHDGDGYADLVLWKKSWRSVAIHEFNAGDESSSKYVVNSQELLMMRFDPRERRFLAPEAAAELEPPPPGLCYREFK